MKKISLLLVSAILFFACSDDDKDIIHVLDLPTYAAEKQDLGDIENPVSKWDDEYGNTYYQTRLIDNTQIFAFDCISSKQYGYAYGFQFTNLTSGNYSAVTKKGVNSNTYVTAGPTEWYDVSVSFQNGNDTDQVKYYTVDGMYVTNSHYAYNIIANGDEKGFANKFEEGDWFKLTIYNSKKTQKVEVFLADFRDGKTEILNSWKWVDLKSLGTTEKLSFELTSSDESDWGMNTPAYFCLDGIKLIEN